MKKIRSFIAAFLLIASFGGSFITLNMPATASADCGQFLGFPAWYDGLTTGDNCEIQSPAKANGGLNGFVWRIVLNVIGMALVAVGYISIAFILYSGFIMIKGITGASPGSPEMAATARKMILNACIGLMISLLAITIVSFISKIYTGSSLSTAFGLPTFSADSVVENVLNLFYFAVGVVSVVMLIIAGYMFSVAGSEPSTLARAKNIIFYTIIGLGVDIFAFALTSFIIGSIGK
jgi:hypothetical protein